MSDAAAPPLEWEADVVLKDGSVAHLRPITPEDAPLVQAFHARQSEESIYLRFFAPMRELSARDLHRFTHVDHHDRVALVATLLGDIIGIGRYDRLDDRGSAEVAFNISDHYQGKGIGSVLLEHLAAIAQEQGIAKFTAEVLPQNRKMLTVFREAGYEVHHKIEDGVVELSFGISPTEKSKAVQLSREHRAEARSMRSILFPERVAVIGASRRSGSVGGIVMDNIVGAGFQGEMYPIHREAAEVRGYRAFHTVGEAPGPIDLAVVVVPAAEVIGVVRECGQAGVKSLLVLVIGLRRGGGGGGRAPGGAAPRGPPRGYAARRPQQLRPHQQRLRRSASTRRSPAVTADRRAARALRPERCARHRRARLGRPPRTRHLRLRLGGQPGRRLGQRPHAVLDRR